MKSISFESYGQYSSDNYGVNTLKFTVGDLEVWFSYKTPVAFRTSEKFMVSKNYWQCTTGKHLNWISRTKERTQREVFERELELAINQSGVTVT